ncbi:hypothetical protein [Streptomyces sp. NPDC058279]|uniref:hypothetical protein n=1 Tax=Streptomyces sp. NPDC058279 TaxID=3346418 RepID=UPI0036E148DE
MIVFRCGVCRTRLSAPVREVALPPEDEAPLPFRQPDGEDCPPRLAPGTFAYDLSFRQRPGARVGPLGPVLAPVDVRGVVPLPHRRHGCCGPSGSHGPNLACAGCGAEVAVETADCYTPQQVALDPASTVAEPQPGE